MNVLIVDDEPLARQEIRRLLGRYSQLDSISEAADGAEALALLQEQEFQVVFVDIRMPEMDGIELVASAGNRSLFVFCTAYSQHALEAFDLNAFDYLLKPVNPNRLDQVMAKVDLALSGKSYHGQQEQEKASTADILPENHGFLLKFGHDYRIVRLQDVLRFEALGNHVVVHLEKEKSYIQSSLSRLEAKLDDSHFLKASRSDVVRIDAICKVEEGMNPGSLMVQLSNGQSVDVSRRQAQYLKKQFSI
ncbi:LytR/AlgR family response regulator transcription factor [Pseudoteredinibacter isoporae]|uniref:Two-component system LytT family response regulator n=1 Tax=Pseudoteredinibacter isoporae TaxID=570281 RepID=A0A7X0MUT2_9GAMM|nr:LytTR family DNA-binding domain-containing protein [Pseudoteredinibacter isoporae]MBB6520623.1 two-component system LytT family response regulator [Pseudoteredinibacter isoporae]NHO86190.1 response regulator transcription factor [Pseudoteredinibacter isoporae]NIB25359.1 response regulator transcription factor [Pseudoteredinibacter isoporae]